MKIRRVMLAAPKSGSGKTMLTCSLLQSLKNRGEQAVSFKCGPDYIDPMFHEKAIGIPSKNLDTFFTGQEETRKLFLKGRKEEEIAVLEGVMGLFDGLGGIRDEGSSYDLARATRTPIILVVDAKGMGRSVVAMVAGFLAYDSEKLIKGVILNRMSKPYYEKIKPLLEELGITVFGYFPEQKDLHVESRHLGLVMPGELEGIREQLYKAAEEFAKTVSVDKIIETAEQAEELLDDEAAQNSVSSEKEGKTRTAPDDTEKNTTGANQTKVLEQRPVIAVAKDEAFCFYYAENISLLQEKGAEIRYFSPLHDAELPDPCDGILLGGGYPELYADKLAANESMRRSIRQAAEKNIPIVAECGGFMYLHTAITDKDGNCYDMAGVLSGTCHYTGKLVRFGYIELQEKQENFLSSGEKIKAHEFHYFDSSYNGDDCQATKPVTGKSYDCILDKQNRWLGFPHLYYPSNPAFAQRFVEMAEEYRENRIKK